MDYYGIFPAIGPVPWMRVEHPTTASTRCRPARTRSRSTRPTRSWCWSRTTSGTRTPTRSRHQYVDKYTFAFDGDNSVADKTVLSDQGTNTIVTSMLAQDYTKAVQDGLDAQVHVGPQPCTGLDAELQEDPGARSSAGDRLRLPLRGRLVGGGRPPGVTLANGATDPDLGFGLLPPGMAGREAWTGEIDGETIQYDPEHAKELLAKAGYEPGEYEASWVYDSSSPEGKAATEQSSSPTRSPASTEAVPVRRRQPLRRLDRPGQRPLQEDQHPRHRLVPGLAVGVDLPARHRRHREPLQHRWLLGAGGRRRDRAHPDRAPDRGAG